MTSRTAPLMLLIGFAYEHAVAQDGFFEATATLALLLVVACGLTALTVVLMKPPRWVKWLGKEECRRG